MPASVTISIDTGGVPEALRDWVDNWPELGRSIVEEIMEFAELQVKRQIRAAELVFRGVLLNDIQTQVGLEGSDANMRVVGTTFTDLVYGAVMEFGRKPGKAPPTAALLPWVRRKMGVAKDKAEGVAFVVARSIGRKGITGRHYFKKAQVVVDKMSGKITERRVDEFLTGLGF